MSKPKLIMIINEDRFFLSHRKPIALAAKDSGYEVIIVAKDTGHRKEIENLGVRFIDLPINPTGMNPLQESKTFFFLKRLYKKECPTIVHHVGLKNILWGGLAAKITGVKGVVNAVSGLGSLFNGDNLSIVARMILRVMAMSNRRSGVRVIFQNNDDLNLFLKKKVVLPEQIEFTKGSGIDLDEYHLKRKEEIGRVKIIFTARMVKEKGVEDLISAANLLREKFEGRIQFLLCGRTTSNKSGITKEYLDQHCDGNYICWLGERNNIKDLLAHSHIMAFPSYYREGVPKSLIEASAMGLPIVTCDSIGCRDVVEDGANGLLVPPKNPELLALALKKLIDNKDLRIKMGKKSREKAEAEFSIDKVIKTHLKVYSELSGLSV